MNMEQLSTHLYTWQKAEPLISREWRKGNRYLVGDAVPAIPLRRGTPYYIPEAHRLSHARHDPLLAPHGFFRALPSKRNTAAIEFVEKFGPLDWPVEIGKVPELVLDDFWLKHLRYISVVRLWEARDDEGGLRNAFSDLRKNLDQIHLAEGWEIPFEFDREYDSEHFDEEDRHLREAWRQRLGFVPNHPLGSLGTWRTFCPLPWEEGGRTFEEWLGATVFKALREAAIQIFHGELNLHLAGREPRWARNDVDDPRQPPSFQFFITGGDLWQIIWELTGLDTAQMRSWRICPDCNKLFYPKRSDQYYCKSEEQVRASKRNYARTRRQRERLEKLFTTAEDTPKSKLVRKKRCVAQRNKELATNEQAK